MDTHNQQTPPDEKKEPSNPDGKVEIMPSGFKPKKEHMQNIFLEHFPRLGTITATCNAIGLDRGTVTTWRKRDPEFERRFVEADGIVTDALEGTAMARALRESDTLLIFLLKARNPDKYKDRIQHEIDPKVIETIIAQFISVVKRYAHDYCPHCKAHLGLTGKIAKELESLSGRLSQT